MRRTLTAAVLLLGLTACGGEHGPPVRVTIARGSGMNAAADSLAAHGIVRWPTGFRLYGRMRGANDRLQAGTYELRRGTSWAAALDKILSGDVVKGKVAVPEGWSVRQIAERVAAATALPADSVVAVALDSIAARGFGVPGPTLEGYLYPATYEFPLGTPARRILRQMTRRYDQAWTAEMRARADSLGMTEREVVTLASIVEKEARVWSERENIAAVYHNRLRIGMPLQADPTVQYARGVHQARLLYSHIDEVADHPYNTYRRRGLPPGPIGSPSRGAILAVLNPADVPYLYFVARPDGTHVFSRTLTEHNRAKRAARVAGDGGAPATAPAAAPAPPPPGPAPRR